MMDKEGGILMIKITDKSMKELCEKLSISQKELSFLGGGREDSDGTVYTYQEGNKKKVLKILAIPEGEKESFARLETRISYANYLGEHGIKLSYPLQNRSGNLYEVSLDNKHYYTAYVMDFSEGRNPESNELTDELVYKWGILTGKSHAVTKTFHGYGENKKMGYAEEMSFFTNWCKDPDVKKSWTQLKQELSKLPKDACDYGFIHNDNNQRNIIMNGTDLTLIDFDCASDQFFIQDITTPAQGIMFDITGGMVSPLKDDDRLKRFFDSFINGYETQNHLDDKWYERIPMFINYRRMLLFTCMQDWLNTEPELQKAMKKNILNFNLII